MDALRGARKSTKNVLIQIYLNSAFYILNTGCNLILSTIFYLVILAIVYIICDDHISNHIAQRLEKVFYWSLSTKYLPIGRMNIEANETSGENKTSPS